MTEPIHILYVDDARFDRELVRDVLQREHAGYQLTEAASREEFQAGLAKRSYDVVLSDFNILGFEGLQVIDAVKAKDPHVPVVIVTGTGSEEVAVEAMKRGAADYVIKTPLHIQRLPHTIQTALAKKRLEEEREHAEQKVKEYADRLEVLSRRLLEVQEVERRHLACELHDELGQLLSIISMNLQSLLGKMGEREQQRLEESISIVSRAIEQVRSLSLDLRPSLLDDFGLDAALRWYVERQAQRAGFTAQLTSYLREKRLPAEVETACFRIVQEALTNIARHAQARQVTIELQPRDGELHLVIQDDGVGFDLEAARQRSSRGESFGLMGMQERVHFLGGKITFQSAPGQGTRIEATLPLQPKSSVISPE